MNRWQGAPPETIPQQLVEQMVEALERESSEDWTREFAASGGKTTLVTTET